MKKLMTHLYWGDPTAGFSFQLAKTLLDSGADMLEVGIPYTDPVCDGEVFQRACTRAITGGMTPLKVFDGIERLRDAGYAQPIYLTSYYGPICAMGAETVARKAKAVGVTGCIVPDLLLEEQGEFRKVCGKYGLSVIQFATVYSSKERLHDMCEASTDFIYCIALPGITGDKRRNKDDVKQIVRSLKQLSEKEIFVGFGISSPLEAKEILSFDADGIIVGSAITKLYETKTVQPNKKLPEIASFVKHLKAVTIEPN